MRIFAYCTLPSKNAVREATGIEPYTSPPLTVQLFDPIHLMADVIYIRLHGLPLIPTRWFGEDDDHNLIAALGQEHIRQVRLPSSVVILANCYGADSPMIKDFYDSGASAVIAGHGLNYAARNQVVGADKLAREVIEHLKRGDHIEQALGRAKMSLRLTAFRFSDRDALEFKIMEKY